MPMGLYAVYKPTCPYTDPRLSNHAEEVEVDTCMFEIVESQG